MRLRVPPRILIAITMCSALLASGCGQVSPKQVRVEAASVASTATEGQTVSSQYAKGELGRTFTHTQLQKLASQAGGPASSLGSGPAVPGVAKFAAETQALALESQRTLNRLAARTDYPEEGAAARQKLETIAQRASDLSDQAEAIELAEDRDQ